MRIRLLLLLSTAILGLRAGAVEPLDVHTWESIDPPETPGVALSRASGHLVLRSERAGTWPLGRIDGLELVGCRFALRCLVSHAELDAPAFFEVWWELADGESFFTRNLAEAGPMRSLRGTAGWREVRLPADLGDEGRTITACRLALHTGSGGLVRISDWQLLAYDPGENLLAGVEGTDPLREPLPEVDSVAGAVPEEAVVAPSWSVVTILGAAVLGVAILGGAGLVAILLLVLGRAHRRKQTEAAEDASAPEQLDAASQPAQEEAEEKAEEDAQTGELRQMQAREAMQVKRDEE